MEAFESLVTESQKVLIMGHQTPDYDAYSSGLLMKLLLTKRFPKKEVKFLLDTSAPFDKLSNLVGFHDIEYGTLEQTLQEFNPNLLVLVDGNELKRFTAAEEEVKKLLEGKKLAIFDHHVQVNDQYDFLCNEQRTSGVETIYQYLVAQNGWEVSQGWEELVLTGIVGDTYRFYHDSKSYRETFSLVANILDKGYSLRDVSDRLFGYTKEELKVISLFLSRVAFRDSYCFSYLTMEDYEKKIASAMDTHTYKKVRRYFIDEMLNKVYEYPLSFILAPDNTRSDRKTYAGSFRSKERTIDTVILAKYLDGGGHVTGSGFEVKADSIKEAIEKVESVIIKHYDEAIITEAHK